MGFFEKITARLSDGNSIRSETVETSAPGQVTFKLADLNEIFNRQGGRLGGGPDMSEATYYTCLKILSETVAKLSIHLYDGNGEKVKDHHALTVLKYRPNEAMTSVTLKQVVEYNRDHFGNGYLLTKYGKDGKLQGLYPLNPMKVKVLVDNQSIFPGDRRIWYEYTPKTGETVIISSKEMIHVKGGLSTDGVVGMSVRETLARTMETNKASQDYLKDLYSNGLTANAVLKYTGDLDKEKRKELTKQVAELIDDEESNSKRILPIPLGMDIVPLDLKLTDSQFYELKKYSSLQIAAAFGIKPNHLNDYEKSSYANSESQNLSFYVDTLLYILTAYEEEFNRKLLTESELKSGLRFKFNVGTILRGDLKTQAEALRMQVDGAMMTLNEARAKLDLPPIQGGDIIIVNGSYTTLEDVGIAYRKDNKNAEN